MKLPGYLDPSFVPPAPFIYAEIESRTHSLKGTIAFMIDTGSSVTTIVDRDRERLGINWNNLETTNRPLAGIGGTVDTRIIKHATLAFKTESEKIVQEKLSIHVARHDLAGLDRRGIERVLQLPSLLGRDMIERYRLVYDKSRRLIFLDTDPLKGIPGLEGSRRRWRADYPNGTSLKAEPTS